MDQVKTGKFIKAVRKEQNYTQREVAEQLGISEKTVSKWETGNGLPEAGLMLPLCNLLGIGVNELLSGERLDEKQYHQRAEETIMDLLKERAEAKKKLVMSVVICVTTILAGVAFVMLAGLLEMEAWLRIVLIVLAIVVMGSGIALACVLDREAGVYECRHCGKQFVPSMWAYVKGAHSLTTRWLKCPHCGKRSFCKKRLSKTE